MERMDGASDICGDTAGGRLYSKQNMHQGLDTPTALDHKMGDLSDGDSVDMGVWNIRIWIRCAGFYIWRFLIREK